MLQSFSSSVTVRSKLDKAHARSSVCIGQENVAHGFKRSEKNAHPRTHLASIHFLRYLCSLEWCCNFVLVSSINIMQQGGLCKHQILKELASLHLSRV